MEYDDYKKEVIDKRQAGRKLNPEDFSVRRLRRRLKRKDQQPRKVLFRQVLAKATKNFNQINLLKKELETLKMYNKEMEADIKTMKEHIDRWVKEENAE